MPNYKNKNRKSGISSFAVERNGLSQPILLTVVFKSGASYSYSIRDYGLQMLTEMVELAERGFGLNTYLNRNQNQKSKSKSKSKYE